MCECQAQLYQLIQKTARLEKEIGELRAREQPKSADLARLTAQQTFTGTQTVRHPTGYGTVLNVQSNAGDIRFAFSTNDNGSATFGTETNHNFGLNVAGSQRVFFSASGAVLIGRTSGLTGAGDLDANGRVRGATFETSGGNKWTLGGYTPGALATIGSVSVVVDGVTRRLLVG